MSLLFERSELAIMAITKGMCIISQENHISPRLYCVWAASFVACLLSKFPRPLYILCNKYKFLRWGIVSPPPNPQVGVPPRVGCLLLLTQYTRSHPPHLEAVFSIRNLRTRCAVVTRDTLNTYTPPQILLGRSNQGE
jgi:hypothetical protein